MNTERSLSTLFRNSMIIEKALPLYEPGLYSPIEAIAKGAGNCAARAFFSGVDLLENGFDDVGFLIQKSHGTRGNPEHAAVDVDLLDVGDVDQRFVIESNNESKVWPTVWTPRIREHYESFTLEEGIAVYADRLGGVLPSFDEMYEAVRRSLLLAKAL